MRYGFYYKYEVYLTYTLSIFCLLLFVVACYVKNCLVYFQKWIKENKVLQIVLRDSLHQPQYVEKLEKILRFIIKERALTLEDLDNIWAAQAGKHEAIVKNVHDLLAKLAWDFSPEQLDHLFECFQVRAHLLYYFKIWQ